MHELSEVGDSEQFSDRSSIAKVVIFVHQTVVSGFCVLQSGGMEDLYFDSIIIHDYSFIKVVPELDSGHASGIIVVDECMKRDSCHSIFLSALLGLSK